MATLHCKSTSGAPFIECDGVMSPASHQAKLKLKLKLNHR